MDLRWSPESREELARSILSRDPDYIEGVIIATEETIENSKNETIHLQAIKKALISNDCEYLDKYVSETEKSSQEYIRGMIG